MMLAPLAAKADDTQAQIELELNALDPGEGSCRLTFVVVNSHETPLDKLVYETVLFDASGRVERLTLFDFGAVPSGPPRVRQFDIPGLDCGNIGRVLINGPSACDGAGVDPMICTGPLKLGSRTDAELIG
ncbi:hypothetical protein AIOL_002691 [Candidatus Rhodobacter oscarellae]|uniref:Uncharacterized protein n=2 Tax=Candidatus Rhodobacter oscarellae TaxID=1675527 RepID=A0A0J9E7F8_9RHOB|nr:hypothetical protein AIOL_002691 [Candidatus Rhodobacter lobularis]